MPTLAGWLRMSMREVTDIEEGGVPVSAELVAVWCAELGVDPGPVLARAADYAPPGIDVAVVDLRSIAELPHHVGWWAELGQWARALLAGNSTPRLMLRARDIQRLAAQWHVSKGELIGTLRDFAPLQNDEADS